MILFYKFLQCAVEILDFVWNHVLDSFIMKIDTEVYFLDVRHSANTFNIKYFPWTDTCLSAMKTSYAFLCKKCFCHKFIRVVTGTT